MSDQTADGLWLQVRERFIAGEGAGVSGRNGRTRELRPVMLELQRPRERWVLSRDPLNPAAVLSEVVWILNGRDDSRVLNFFNTQLPRYAGEGPTYYGAYGHRLRVSFGFDQLVAAAAALKANPASRQVCVSIWDPRLDMPAANGGPRSPDIPCNIVGFLKVREGCLDWTQIMRSNDFWLGLPFNIVQFTTIQEVMAGWLGLEVGSYYHFADSLHVYEEHEAAMRAVERLQVVPLNKDDLTAVGQAESESVLSDMWDRLRTVVDCDSCDWEALRPPDQWPSGYANMMRVLLAEAARRKNEDATGRQFLDECTNDLLVRAQERWLDRIG